MDKVNLASQPEVNSSSDYSIFEREIVCHFCNAVVYMPTLYPGEQIQCPRCDETLVRIEKYPVAIPIIYSGLAIFVFLLSLLYPLLTVTTPYIHVTRTVGLWVIFNYLAGHSPFLAFIYLFSVFVTPFIFTVATLYVFSAIHFKKHWWRVEEISEILVYLRPWVMVDIFLVGCAIALVKIGSLSTFEVGYTFITIFAYSIFLARIVLSISEYWIKEKLLNIKGETIRPIRHSLRTLRNRGWLKVNLSWALLFAAIIFYLPANLMPMMSTFGLGLHYETTLLEGIVQIWKKGDYFISSIIFVASFLIPIFKIFSLLILLLAVSYKHLLKAKTLTWIFVSIERMGRWSMIDVFVIMLMVSLFTSRVIYVRAGPASIYFCLVVIITMVATSLIDTRLFWDDFKETSRRSY